MVALTMHCYSVHACYSQVARLYPHAASVTLTVKLENVV